MSNPFDPQRARALYLIGLIRQTCQKYEDILQRAAFIRRGGTDGDYGEPHWSASLLRVYDDLGRSLLTATAQAELRSRP